MQSAKCRAWEKKLRVVEAACRGSCVSYKKQSVSYNKQGAACRGIRRSNMQSVECRGRRRSNMQSAKCRAWEKKLRVVEVACLISCVRGRRRCVS
jgi:hypothetical protein